MNKSFYPLLFFIIGTEEKIQELLESRKRLDNKIELLQELKEAVLPPQENTASTSSTMSE